MRGPSSSHCAAAARIGRLALALMDNTLECVNIAFDHGGSLATTHESQGSDMGLLGGLLGLAPSDERIVNYQEEIRKAGIQVRFETGFFADAHPNTYRLNLKNRKEEHSLLAVSTGGGMIELVAIDGYPVSIRGDRYELLVFVENRTTNVLRKLEDLFGTGSQLQVLEKPGTEKGCVRLSSYRPVSTGLMAAVFEEDTTTAVKALPPVLPVLTPDSMDIPFLSCEEMLVTPGNRHDGLAQLALKYESARSGMGRDEVLENMKQLVTCIHDSLQRGLSGTSYAHRILKCQSIGFGESLQSGRLLDLGLLNRVILFVTALMEVKSSMGVIVAAPTAGACAAMPGAVLGAGDALGSDLETIAESFLAAGMIGVFISKYSTFAAEVAGCQAECGAASGMAAAALVTLMGGDAETSVAAASMALQNSLGMICDPVANRVEVPCLGKNVMAASNAVSCANMALAGFDPVIPLDEVIQTMDTVGKSIPFELRCTALGGLSITRTSKIIQERLQDSQG